MTRSSTSRANKGSASWTKLKAYAEPASHVRHTRIFVAGIKWIADRVHGLLRTRHSAGPAALEQIREWRPRFDGCSDEEIRQAPFTEADGRTEVLPWLLRAGARLDADPYRGHRLSGRPCATACKPPHGCSTMVQPWIAKALSEGSRMAKELRRCTWHRSTDISPW